MEQTSTNSISFSPSVSIPFHTDQSSVPIESADATMFDIFTHDCDQKSRKRTRTEFDISSELDILEHKSEQDHDKQNILPNSNSFTFKTMSTFTSSNAINNPFEASPAFNDSPPIVQTPPPVVPIHHSIIQTATTIACKPTSVPVVLPTVQLSVPPYVSPPVPVVPPHSTIIPLPLRSKLPNKQIIPLRRSVSLSNPSAPAPKPKPSTNNLFARCQQDEMKHSIFDFPNSTSSTALDACDGPSFRAPHPFGRDPVHWINEIDEERFPSNFQFARDMRLPETTINSKQYKRAMEPPNEDDHGKHQQAIFNTCSYVHQFDKF
jgi:hypothetical protein